MAKRLWIIGKRKMHEYQKLQRKGMQAFARDDDTVFLCQLEVVDSLEMVTLNEAADLLNVNYATVRAMIARGKLTAYTGPPEKIGRPLIYVPLKEVTNAMPHNKEYYDNSSGNDRQWS